MEMTIDNHIEVLKSYNHGFTGCAGTLQDSIDVAIEAMRKYQKIKELMDKEVPECIHPLDRDKYKLGTIRKVIEDGKND